MYSQGVQPTDKWKVEATALAWLVGAEISEDVIHLGSGNLLMDELGALAASNPAAAVFEAHDRVLKCLRTLLKRGKPGPVAGTAGAVGTACRSARTDNPRYSQGS